MSASNAKVQSVIENMFTSAIKKLTADESGSLLSDMYVMADVEDGEVQVFGEDEKLLEKVVIFDWINGNADTLRKRVIPVLKAMLTSLNAKRHFNHACFLHPFSVSLVDENFAVTEELLFIGDDTFRLDDPLLKDLDAELDAFLKDLLSDMPK
ncbi:MAG: hypothetical protein LBJ58_06315 [Tannerellaceae bacterium]|jgi:hypothetical protein|nr:hypothetical protein [Tannerellaceae bacterium]